MQFLSASPHITVWGGCISSAQLPYLFEYKVRLFYTKLLASKSPPALYANFAPRCGPTAARASPYSAALGQRAPWFREATLQGETRAATKPHPKTKFAYNPNSARWSWMQEGESILSNARPHRDMHMILLFTMQKKKPRDRPFCVKVEND